MMPATTLLMMPCGGCKLDRPAYLFDLYTGPLWQTLRMHRGALPRDNVMVLSARYGFRCSWMMAEPYDERLSAEKADSLIRGGIMARNDEFGAIRKGCTGMHPYVEAGGRRGLAFQTVIVAGAGHYRRVFEAFIPQLQEHGNVARGAVILTVDGGVGEQRSQLGRWLAKINAAGVAAIEAEAAAISQGRA